MTRISTIIVSVLCAATLLSACSRRQQQWESARTADTIESYQVFLKTFPEGEFVSQAQARVKELQEARDWQQAIMTDTPEGYQQFLNQYPEGRMSDEARIRIENFALAQPPAAGPEEPAVAASGEVQPPSPEAAVAPPAVARPGPPPAAKPQPAATQKTPMAGTAGAGFRVQLGAFTGGEKQAMSEWRTLQQRYPKLLGGLSPSVKLATTPSGHLYRLQAGKTNEARAREICSSLKTKGQACVVVLP